MSEERFYSIDNVEDFSANVCDLIDTFKYLVSCVVHGINPEDAEKLTPELLEAFIDVAGSFQDYINAVDYYTVELELFKEYEKDGEVEKIRANYGEFVKEVSAELKSRLEIEAKKKFNL